MHKVIQQSSRIDCKNEADNTIIQFSELEVDRQLLHQQHQQQQLKDLEIAVPPQSQQLSDYIIIIRKNEFNQMMESQLLSEENRQIDKRQFIRKQVVHDDSDDQRKIGFSNETWKRSAINILLRVLRFISFITKSNFATSFQFLTYSVFMLIGDKSSDFWFYKYGNYLKYEKPSRIQYHLYQFQSRFIARIQDFFIVRKISQKSFLFMPESCYMVLWNIYILLILTINVYYIALKYLTLSILNIFDRLTFDFQNHSNDSYKELLFVQIPSYSFVLEVLVKFNTCHYYKGNIISNRFQIAQHYIKTSFLIDIIVVIPFFLSLQFSIPYLDLVIVLKIFQISKLADSLFDRLELSQSQIALFDLLKLIYLILFVAHICACIWIVVGQTSNGEESWITVEGIQNSSWDDIYFHSFYWAIVTMTTIGYGDINPVNLRERKYSIGLFLIACGVFAYSLNNIGNIFGEFAKQNNQFRTNMNNLKKYLRQKGINVQLREKIRRYFEYIWSEENEDNQEEFEFEELIPTHLKKEMSIDIHFKLINSITFFKDNFSTKFLTAMSSIVQQERFGPDEIIYQRDQPCDYLYILKKGEVSQYITMDDNQNSLKILETFKSPYSIFGQLDFMQDWLHSTDCKSNIVSYVLKISRNDLINLLMKYPNDYQKYYQIFDQVRFSNKLDQVQINCRACNKTNHAIIDCPQPILIYYLLKSMIRGTPNRSKVILNHKRNIPSDRSSSNRTNHKRQIQTLIEQLNIEESVLFFLLHNQQFDDEALDIKQQLKSAFQRREDLENSNFEHKKSKKTSLNFEKSSTQLYSEETVLININWHRLELNVPKEIQHIKTLIKMKQVLKISSSIILVENQSIYQQKQSSPLDTFKPDSLSEKENLDHFNSEKQEKIGSQYVEIFYNFERYKNYDNYFEAHNVSSYINQNNMRKSRKVSNQIISNNFKSKPKTMQRQKTLMDMLKKTRENNLKQRNSLIQKQ